MSKREWFYPTAFDTWGDEERAAVARVVASGRFTAGEEVAAFESEFAAFHRMRHCIMVNSGSSANLIALASLFHVEDRPLRRGDLAVVPAMAWGTTYAPLVQHGLGLALVDCGPSWNADYLNGLTPGMRNDARLYVGCSVLGNPADLHLLAEIAAGRRAFMLEDNCESFGASPDFAQLTGTFGHVNTFSFFWSHQLSAIEGGAILTNSAEVDGLCRMLRDHGLTRSVRPAGSFDTEYDFRLFGYNVRPLEMHAALLEPFLERSHQ